MTEAQLLSEILHEVDRAEQKHPNWPSDLVHQAAIVVEESGEMIREALRIKQNEGGTLDELRAELVQTAAMCVRMLKNLPE